MKIPVSHARQNLCRLSYEPDDFKHYAIYWLRVLTVCSACLQESLSRPFLMLPPVPCVVFTGEAHSRDSPSPVYLLRRCGHFGSDNSWLAQHPSISANLACLRFI